MLCQPTYALRADRERRPEVTGVGVEQVNRELIAEHESQHARQHTQHDRAEQLHAMTVAGV